MRLLLAALVLLAVAGLVGLSIWAAQRETDVRSVTAVAVRGDAVYVAVGGEVWITDAHGARRGALLGRDGQPWSGETPTSIAIDAQGHILVAEAVSHRVTEFGPDGREIGPRPLPLEPKLRFLVEPAREGLWVADTIGHRLVRVRADGSSASRPVRYPNGLHLIEDGERTLALVASTGMGQAFALDDRMATAEYGPIAQLNAALARRTAFHTLMDLAPTPGGALVATLCRNALGDCLLWRLAPGALAPEVVGSLDFLRAPEEALNPDLMMFAQSAVAADGRVLVASSRLPGVVEFSGPGGPPPPGFCSDCSPEGLAARAAPPGALEAGVAFPNGARVALFGDAASS